MGVCRMTRLTSAFSKKWENHEYALANSDKLGYGRGSNGPYGDAGRIAEWASNAFLTAIAD